MASVEIVNSVVESVYVGSTNVANPVLIMEVDGVVVPGNYLLQSSGSSRRYIFPRSANGAIYVTSVSIVYGTPLPAISKYIKVYAAEAS
jgi:hypothetical protein